MTFFSFVSILYTFYLFTYLSVFLFFSLPSVAYHCTHFCLCFPDFFLYLIFHSTLYILSIYLSIYLPFFFRFLQSFIVQCTHVSSMYGSVPSSIFLMILSSIFSYFPFSILHFIHLSIHFSPFPSGTHV